jgi:hypothetical protein
MDLHAARGRAAPARAKPRARNGDEETEAAATRAALAAEFPRGVEGHVLSMTIDWSGGVPGISVATCQCGACYRAPRHLPMSGHDVIDRCVLRHWRQAAAGAAAKKLEAAE